MSAIAVNLPDAHLSRLIWADYPELAYDSFFSFEQACHYCLKHRLALVLPGDVINKSVQDDGEVIRFLDYWLDRLRSNSCRVFFTQGQHERTRNTPWLFAANQWAYHVHRQPFALGGLMWYGMDFVPAGQLQDELERIPEGTEVLVCHQVWEELMGIEGRPEGSFRQIPKVRVVLTGDFHGHKTVQCQGRDGQMMLVVSSGSTHMRSLTEDPNKFFHVLHDDGTVESVRLDTRPYLRYEVRTEEQLQALLLRLPGEAEAAKKEAATLSTRYDVSTPIVHLRYDESVSAVRQRAQKVLGSNGFLFDRVIETKPAAQEEDLAHAWDVIDAGMEGALDLEVESGSAVHTTCRRLLSTPPHQLRDEIKAVVAEKMAADEADTPFTEAT